MFRLLIFINLISVSIWAKTPYRVAVCGNSRYVEELELVLELDQRILVAACSEKKLDARLKVAGDRIELVDSKVSWVKRNFSVTKFLVELAQPKSSQSLRAERSKPALIAALPENPHNDDANSVIVTHNNEPVVELLETIEEEPRTIHWMLDTGVTLDQWSAVLSTKLYPGVQVQSKVEVSPSWWLGNRFAFGTSAFKIDDQTVWNQQVGNHLWASKQFEVVRGLTMGPSVGYFFWGSFSSNHQITQFQKHDISLGGRMMWISPKRRFELECASSFLPVHLGVEGLVAMRLYLGRSWYAALQGYGVGVWGMSQSGSFLSASLALGYAQ